MRTISVSITAGLLAILVMVLAWLGYRPGAPAVNAPGVVAQPSGPVLRLGLIPERDVFAQRRAYQELADYLSGKISMRVELATANSYRGVLDDFREKEIDAAFLGSLVTVLAVDREGAEISCKPEYEDGTSTYRGVIFVRADSPIKSIDDLAGRSLGMVRTTTAGHLFPMWLLAQQGTIAGPKAPRFVWIGTHDDVINEVATGQVEAGAAKDLRLEAYEKQNPGAQFRCLASSEPVPENALVWRHDVPASKRNAIITVLAQMQDDAVGRQVLAKLKIRRFVHCHIPEYRPVYLMVEQMGPLWAEMGIDGAPPKEPASGKPD